MLTRERRTSEERTRRRFARRQWRRRWGVWRWMVAGLLAVGLLGGTVWLVFFSSVLALTGVTVDGASYLTSAQIERAAQAPTGTPLVRMDLEAIQARVEALTPVASAEVTRVWPDRLRIDVTEREAVAVVDVEGTLHGMDADGVLFRTYPGRPRSLPDVRLSADADASTRREVAGVLAAMPPDLARRVDYLEARSVDQISLVLRDGRTVAWGSADQSTQKAAVLESLLGVDAEAYDVSVPGRPTTRG